MSVLETVKGRFSVRNYHDEPVDDNDLSFILESARFSQSARNLQDWRFIVVREKSARARLAKAAKGQRFVAEAPVVIVCCGVGTEYIMTCGQYAYTIDVSIAMENMALTAHERGLGTCWLGAFYENMVKDVVGIPETEDVRIVGLLTLGRPATEPPLKKRKSIDKIVDYETWRD